MGLLDVIAKQSASGGAPMLTEAQDRLRSMDESLKRLSGTSKEAVNPYVVVIEKQPGEVETIDLEKVLPAGFSAGHIRNIGPEEIDVSFQTGPSTNQYSSPYPLPPMDDPLDLGKFALRKIRFSFPESNTQKGRVVVLLQ